MSAATALMLALKPATNPKKTTGATTQALPALYILYLFFNSNFFTPNLLTCFIVSDTALTCNAFIDLLLICNLQEKSPPPKFIFKGGGNPN